MGRHVAEGDRVIVCWEKRGLKQRRWSEGGHSSLAGEMPTLHLLWALRLSHRPDAQPLSAPSPRVAGCAGFRIGRANPDWTPSGPSALCYRGGREPRSAPGASMVRPLSWPALARGRGRRAASRGWSDIGKPTAGNPVATSVAPARHARSSKPIRLGAFKGARDVPVPPRPGGSRWAPKAGDDLVQEFKGMLDARKAGVGLTAVGQGQIMAGSDLTDLWPLRHLLRAAAETAGALVTGNVTISAASSAQSSGEGPPGPGLPSAVERRLT